MKKLRNILLAFLLCISFQVIPVHAANVANQSNVSAQEERTGIFEELHYRLFEKDTKDFFDYLLLAIFIIGLLIVMVFQNTHHYVVVRPKEDILVEKNYNIEELKEESEILSSDMLEEESE